VAGYDLSHHNREIRVTEGQKPGRIWHYIAAALLAGSAGMVAIGLVPWKWIHAEAAPAWVQAVGSILAILTSAAVVWWQVGKQHRLQIDHEARSKLDAERETLLAFTALAQHAHHLLERVWQITIEPQDAQAYFRTQLEADGLDLVQQALNGYSPVGLPHAGSVMALLAVRRAIDLRFAEIYSLRNYKAPPDWEPSDLEGLRTRMWHSLHEVHRNVIHLMERAEHLRKLMHGDMRHAAALSEAKSA
jgi:hypothetical protein